MAAAAPKSSLTLHTHLAGRAHLPGEARGAGEAGAARGSAVALGALVTLWRRQPASALRSQKAWSHIPGSGSWVRVMGQRLQKTRTHFSPRGARVSLLALWKEDKGAAATGLLWARAKPRGGALPSSRLLRGPQLLPVDRGRTSAQTFPSVWPCLSRQAALCAMAPAPVASARGLWPVACAVRVSGCTPAGVPVQVC